MTTAAILRQNVIADLKFLKTHISKLDGWFKISVSVLAYVLIPPLLAVIVVEWLASAIEVSLPSGVWLSPDSYLGLGFTAMITFHFAFLVARLVIEFAKLCASSPKEVQSK